MVSQHRFQFHTGSIKSGPLQIQPEGPQRSFNSILVRLKARLIGLFRFAYDRFNSILVRLKDGAIRAPGRSDGWFQFHTGSIKSGSGMRCLRGKVPFQFHTGSIKRLHPHELPVPVPRFNSILVRLKVCAAEAQAASPGWFQFHTGSIKRASRR